MVGTGVVVVVVIVVVVVNLFSNSFRVFSRGSSFFSPPVVEVMKTYRAFVVVVAFSHFFEQPSFVMDQAMREREK